MRTGCCRVAAYASCVHQREFALQGGADAVSASVWPLSVDGLLLLATVGLLQPSGVSRRAKGERRQRGEDPLLVRARMLDARHRELHYLPA
ncbi:DUF2637 domain-containing protein [Streptomyces sp. NBC_00104]|uniref:DUF2637 domain-containing protein n=1 Tax=Streptomyces sp. NBC_00024 TaxID=2903612 RepID=UPI0032433C16